MSKKKKKSDNTTTYLILGVGAVLIGPKLVGLLSGSIAPTYAPPVGGGTPGGSVAPIDPGITTPGVTYAPSWMFVKNIHGNTKWHDCTAAARGQTFGYNEGEPQTILTQIPITSGGITYSCAVYRAVVNNKTWYWCWNPNPDAPRIVMLPSYPSMDGIYSIECNN